jgi:serine/threonine protein kinase
LEVVLPRRTCCHATKHFPQLEIIELLGQGGMGAVYKARQPGLDRLVALKMLPPDAALDPTFAERFQREARALAKLNHPNIVAVYDFGQTPLECGGSTPLWMSGGTPPGARADDGFEQSHTEKESGVKPPHSKGLFYFIMSPFRLTRMSECPPSALPEFSAGSFGWYVNGKATIDIDGVSVPVQVGMNLTVIGSKDTPR